MSVDVERRSPDPVSARTHRRRRHTCSCCPGVHLPAGVGLVPGVQGDPAGVGDGERDVVVPGADPTLRGQTSRSPQRPCRRWPVSSPPCSPRTTTRGSTNEGRKELIDHILVSHALVGVLQDAQTIEIDNLPSIGTHPQLAPRAGGPPSDRRPVIAHFDLSSSRPRAGGVGIVLASCMPGRNTDRGRGGPPTGSRSSSPTAPTTHASSSCGQVGTQEVHAPDWDVSHRDTRRC